MGDQCKVEQTEQLLVPVTQCISGSAFCRRTLHAQVIQLATQGTHAVTDFTHRVATGKNAKEHHDQLIPGKKRLVIFITAEPYYQLIELFPRENIHYLS
jgi:hypothetical protein